MRQQPEWKAVYEDLLCTLFLRDGAMSRLPHHERSLRLPLLAGPEGTWFPATFPR